MRFFVVREHRTMEIEQFVRQFEEQFDEVRPGTFSADKKIAELVEWSSMNLLVIIAFIKIEFGIELNHRQLKSCETIRDLFTMVNEHRT